MAIYKPTDMQPSFTGIDISDITSLPIWFSCRIDSNNLGVTAYSIELKNDNGDIIFPKANTELTETITLISDLWQYCNSINDYAVYLRQYGPNVNTGTNESSLVIPFIVDGQDSEIGRTVKNNQVSARDNMFKKGSSYTWNIKLYQGVRKSNDGRIILPTANQYYDMTVATGVIMGSTTNRIQTVPSDEFAKQYYIQPIYMQGVDPNNVDGWLSRTTIPSITQIGNRALVTSYDSQLGHLYPEKEKLTLKTDVEANGFYIYEIGNDPEDLTVYQKVDMVSNMEVPWEWQETLVSDSEQYGVQTYVTTLNPKDNGFYYFSEEAIKLSDTHIRGVGSSSLEQYAQKYRGLRFSGLQQERIALNYQDHNTRSPHNGIFTAVADSKGATVNIEIPNRVSTWTRGIDVAYSAGYIVKVQRNGSWVYYRAIQHIGPGMDIDVSNPDYWVPLSKAPLFAPVDEVTSRYETWERRENGSYPVGTIVKRQDIPTRIIEHGQNGWSYFKCVQENGSGTTDPMSRNSLIWENVSIEDLFDKALNGYSVTVSWYRAPDADTWGELSTKVVRVGDSSPAFAGKNVEIDNKDFDPEKSETYPRINETQFQFVNEKPKDIYTYDSNSTNPLKNQVGLIFQNRNNDTTKLENFRNLVYIRPSNDIGKDMKFVHKSYGYDHELSIRDINNTYWRLHTSEIQPQGSSVKIDAPYKIISYYKKSDDVPFSYYQDPTCTFSIREFGSDIIVPLDDGRTITSPVFDLFAEYSQGQHQMWVNYQWSVYKNGVLYYSGDVKYGGLIEETLNIFENGQYIVRIDMNLSYDKKVSFEKQINVQCVYNDIEESGAIKTTKFDCDTQSEEITVKNILPTFFGIFKRDVWKDEYSSSANYGRFEKVYSQEDTSDYDVYQSVAEPTGDKTAAWDNDTTYDVGSVVTHNDAYWVSLEENINTEPSEDSSYWKRLTDEQEYAFIPAESISGGSLEDIKTDDVVYVLEDSDIIDLYRVDDIDFEEISGEGAEEYVEPIDYFSGERVKYLDKHYYCLIDNGPNTEGNVKVPGEDGSENYWREISSENPYIAMPDIESAELWSASHGRYRVGDYVYVQDTDSSGITTVSGYYMCIKTYIPMGDADRRNAYRPGESNSSRYWFACSSIFKVKQDVQQWDIHLMYNFGAQVRYSGAIYQSIIDNNRSIPHDGDEWVIVPHLVYPNGNQGQWEARTDDNPYMLGNYVLYNNRLFMCVKPNSNITPGVQEFWQEIDVKVTDSVDDPEYILGKHYNINDKVTYGGWDYMAIRPNGYPDETKNPTHQDYWIKLPVRLYRGLYVKPISNGIDITDYNIASNMEYEYAVVFRSFNMETGDNWYIYRFSIKTKWDSWTLTELSQTDDKNSFLTDKDNVWRFRYNVSPGETQQKFSKTEQETLSKFPKFSHGPMNTLSGSVTCLFGKELSNALLSDSIWEYNIDDERFHRRTSLHFKNIGGYKERMRKIGSSNAPIDMLNKWRDVCYSGNPKLLKDPKGNKYIVQITDSSDQINNNWTNYPENISFSWVKIEDANDCLVNNERILTNSINIIPSTPRNFFECTWQEIRAIVQRGTFNSDGIYINGELWWRAMDNREIITTEYGNIILTLVDYGEIEGNLGYGFTVKNSRDGTESTYYAYKNGKIYRDGMSELLPVVLDKVPVGVLMIVDLISK